MRNATQKVSRATSTPKISLEEINKYLSRGCSLHPLIFAHYLSLLIEQERKGKLCLMPDTKLQIHARKFPCSRPYRKTA